MIGNVVVINRGDTYRATVQLTDVDGTPYVMNREDRLYFGLMDPHQPFENALIKKRMTYKDCDSHGVVAFGLKAEDTVDLLPGVYYYAVKLHHLERASGTDEVKTVIAKTKFIVND